MQAGELHKERPQTGIFTIHIISKIGLMRFCAFVGSFFGWLETHVVSKLISTLWFLISILTNNVGFSVMTI